MNDNCQHKEEGIVKIHLSKLSGEIFCGDNRVDILHTVYGDKDKCTCKNCLRVVEKIRKRCIRPIKRGYIIPGVDIE